MALAALALSLASAEAVLQSLKLGVDGEVPLYLSDAEPLLVYGYVAVGERRTLHLRYGDAVETVASRDIEIRRQVACAIPRLVDDLRARRRGAAAQIQESADRLAAYLDTFDHDGTD